MMKTLDLKQNKKLEKIIYFLETTKRRNLRNCEFNDSVPTAYMEGSHRTIDETIEYVKALIKEK